MKWGNAVRRHVGKSHLNYGNCKQAKPAAKLACKVIGVTSSDGLSIVQASLGQAVTSYSDFGVVLQACIPFWCDVEKTAVQSADWRGLSVCLASTALCSRSCMLKPNWEGVKTPQDKTASVKTPSDKKNIISSFSLNDCSRWNSNTEALMALTLRVVCRAGSV